MSKIEKESIVLPQTFHFNRYAGLDWLVRLPVFLPGRPHTVANAALESRVKMATVFRQSTVSSHQWPFLWLVHIHSVLDLFIWNGTCILITFPLFCFKWTESCQWMNVNK